MKRILAALIALFILLTAFPFAMAENDDISQYFKYEVYNGIAAITRYSGTDTDIVVPSEIDGYPVIGINPFAFDDCEWLTSVTLPDSVIFIGSNAFNHCSSLTSVTLSNNMACIAYSAFNGCPALVSVNVSDIADSSENLPSAEDFNLDRELGGEAFQYCASLTSVTVPAGVEAIYNYAFGDCESLTSVTIPASVTFIEEDAFYNCSSFTLTVEPGSYAEQYAIENGIPYTTINPAA